jgi:hypothetical protein
VRTSYFQIRLTPEERAELEAGAEQFGTTVTGLIRKAVKAALTQRSILLPEERAAIDSARDQFRRAAVNLDSLLRQAYLFQDGVMDNGPSEEELRFMLADLRANTERLKLALKKLP